MDNVFSFEIWLLEEFRTIIFLLIFDSFIKSNYGIVHVLEVIFKFLFPLQDSIFYC